MLAKIVGKTVNTEDIRYLLVQGENNSVTINIEMPATFGETSLAGFAWQVRGMLENKRTYAIADVPSSAQGNILRISWLVDWQFTAGDGRIFLMLVGTQGDRVIKFPFDKMYVQKSENGTLAPQPDYFESILSKMAQYASNAQKAQSEAQGAAQDAQNALQNINDRQVIIEQYYTEIKHELDKSIADWKNQADQMLVNMSAYLMDMLRTGEFVSNPVTGSLSTVQGAINSLYSLHTGDALSDAEYEALGLTTAEYEAFGLTTLEYDTQGKIYLRSS